MREYSQLAIKAPMSYEMQEVLKKQDNIIIDANLDNELGCVFVKIKEIDNA